jgi:hypothetical protein
MTGIPTYTSWDPGGSASERTTGIAYWDERANVLDMKSLTEKEFDREIERIPDTVKTFIIEEYRPRGDVNHTGNKLLTSQRIGDIKGYARRHDIKVVEQRSMILKIAAMWAQYKLPPKGQHLPDFASAYLHGYYYLFQQGLIKPKVLDS